MNPFSQFQQFPSSFPQFQPYQQFPSFQPFQQFPSLQPFPQFPPLQPYSQFQQFQQFPFALQPQQPVQPTQPAPSIINITNNFNFTFNLNEESKPKTQSPPLSTITTDPKTNSFTSVKFPSRIHEFPTCKCNRLQNLFKSELKLVLEKLYDDPKYSEFPNKVLIKSKTMEAANQSLKLLLEKQDSMRDDVQNFFSSDIDDNSQLSKIRNQLSEIYSTCFCYDHVKSSIDKHNAGMIILGNEKQIKSIVHTYNSYVKNDGSYREYSELYAVKIGNLERFVLNKKGHTIDFLLRKIKSRNVVLDRELWTIIGLENQIRYGNQNALYSFAFGKREYRSDCEESPYVCARRELFEEFNIFIPKKILNESSKLPLRQYIQEPGMTIFFVHLNNTCTNYFHPESNTICLNKKFT